MMKAFVSLLLLLLVALGGCTTARTDHSLAAAKRCVAPLDETIPKRTDQEINEVFQCYAPIIYGEYREELKNQPTLSGKMVLDIHLTPSGEVSSCRVVSSTLGRPDFEQRVVDQIRNLNFGAKADGALVFKYPIAFLPS